MSLGAEDHSRPTLASDALYRSFFQSFADEIYLHDVHGCILDANTAACSNIGYSREELIQKSVADISASFDAPKLQQLWTTMTVGPHAIASNRHRRKDGSIYHVDVHISCQVVSGHKLFLAVARRTDEKRQQQVEILQLNARLEALVEERTRLWRESSRLLNAVMEQTPDAIFIKDLQSRYIYANDALARQLQCTVQDILGKTDTELYPPEQALAFVRTDEEVLAHDGPCVYEDRMHNGTDVVFANSMKTPYKDENGQVVGILGITRNVSEVRSAQETMAHNYAMLRQAERVAKIGSWTLDLVTNTFSASEMLTEMNGRGPEDPPLTPESLALMIPAEQHATLSAAIGACIQEGTPYTVDVQHQRPAGGTFPARIRGQAYRDAQGKIIMLHGTLQDLSDYVEADQRLRTLADNVPNGAIFRCQQTPNGKLYLKYVSAGIQRLLGFTATGFESDQNLFFSLIDDADKAVFLAEAQRCMRQQCTFDLVVRIRDHEGSIRRVRARAAPRPTHEGMLWEGLLLDVTAEYEVQESLRLAKETAEAAERTKSDFLATMSHEIRTPMNTVIGMTQLLQQTPLSAKQRNYLDKVNFSTNTLLKLINEILDFSKLEADMLHIDSEPFGLDELLNAVTTVTGFRAEQNGVEMAYSIAPSVPKQLLGDVQRLSQILTNLVGNAIKFTERGEVVVSMHAQPDTQSSDPSDWVLHCSVRDTGIGIEPEHMAGLFQPFTQAEAHISRRFGGTGLGLSICQRLVHLMGGNIDVHSQVGQGSTFRFHVRVQVPTQPAALKHLPASVYRVLVVDDSQIARDVLSAMVRGFDLACDVASSGAQALQLLQTASHQSQPYQLVLMDWQMPHMDGLETVERIRTDMQLAHTPAMLMVTAYCRDEILERVAQLELQGLLIKPVTESVLFNAIQEALSSSPPTAPSQHGLQSTAHASSAMLQVPTSLQGRKILVVDDNALNREVAQDFLELAGVLVTTAASGAQALQLLEQYAFDAVLLDVQMPQMDGLELARRIRANPEWQQLPVWALTAQSQLHEREAIVRSGMNGQLTKPIHAQALFHTLAQALQHLPTTAAPPPHTATPTAGMARYFAQQPERMHRLLRSFANEFAHAPAQILTLYAHQDWPALALLAHTLKGALGYLDAPEAVHAMQQLECASQKRAATSQMTAAAAQQLQLVLDRIEDLPPASHAFTQPAIAAIDYTALLAQIDQAMPDIRRGGYAGIQLLEQVENALRGSALHGLAARALALTEDLDIDAASLQLQALTQALTAAQPAPPHSNT
jgi:two-component system, sensor histidine kinase and response regulator